MLVSVTFFSVGSALAGASQNMNMLIAARSKSDLQQFIIYRAESCSQPFKAWEVGGF